MMAGVLSSDVLERQFGPTELEVLYQAAGTRIIRTLAADSRQSLELSLVAFVQAGVEEFPGTHQAVIGGASMGKAFRADGIGFVRQEKAAYRYALPVSFERFFGSREPATVVAVSVLAGPNKTPYAEILETFSPAVRRPCQAGQPTDGQLAKIRLLDEFLAGRPTA
jgi:hypothetical protein